MAMVRDRGYCCATRCGRTTPHRTRRLGADGRHDCIGAHGQTGQAPRGSAKTGSVRKVLEAHRVAVSAFRPKTRLNRKGQPLWTLRTPLHRILHRRSGADELALEEKNPRLPPSPLEPSNAEASSHAPAVMSAASSEDEDGVRDKNAPLAPSACSIARASGGDSAVDTDYHSVLALIEGPSIRPHLRLSEYHLLIGTACALLEMFAPTRALRPFVAAPQAVWSMIVFHVALSLTPGQGLRKQTASVEVPIDAAEACRLAQPDPVVRREAWRMLPRVLNVVYGSSAILEVPFGPL